MNHIYRVVWNKTLRTWQAVRESAHARGKSKSCKSVRLRHAALVIGTPFVFAAAQAADMPTGGAISAGSGSIHQNGNQLTISQTSNKLAIDWQSFSIGQHGSVRFDQPSAGSIALNRVLGPDASLIQGALQANGHVFLVNPNGVLFTPRAQVNVGGLVASTLSLSNEDFLAGRHRFSGDSTASVVNRGSITVGPGGAVALIAASVENQGSISAPQGNVLLGAGQTVTVDLGGPVKLEVEQGALDALIENGGAIRADGGTILLTARAAEDLAGIVINNTGVIEARALAAGKDGSIVLLGENGGVEVGGTLDVSAQAGTGGRIVATGERVAIAGGARIDASGTQGGGEIFVGGGWQGRDPQIANSTQTSVAAGAVLDASATGIGAGGTVVVWADGTTRYEGDIRAVGRGGSGGRVEVSGKDTLRFAGDVDTGGGTLLLDPTNITVQSTDGDLDNTFSAAQIKALLQSNDVTLTADNDIEWATGVTLDYDGIGTGRTLTLDAGAAMRFYGSIEDATPDDDALSVSLVAGGGIILNGHISSGAGGNISLHGGGGVNSESGRIEVGGTGNLIVTGGGNLIVNRGLMQVADGLFSADMGGYVNTIWGGRIVATGTGDIELTGRAVDGGIYIGGGGSSSAGHVWAQSGNVTLTGKVIEVRGSASSNVSGSGNLLLQPHRREDTIGIGNGVTADLLLNSGTLTRLSDGFTSIIIGRSDGTGNVTIGNAAFKEDIVIRAPSGSGSIAINGTLSTTGESLTLEAANGVTQTAAGRVQAGKLLLLGGGAFDLGTGSNNVGTLAADIDGALSFHDVDALTIGTVDGYNGVSTTGATAISTHTGNLTVDQDITTSDASDDAIVLNAGRSTDAGTASGGNILLNAALEAGAGGRATLYTGSIAGSTGVIAAAGGAGSGRFRYGSDESASAYTATLGSGTYAIYREQPTLSIAPGTASGQYGDIPDLDELSFSASGFQNGDSGGFAGTANFTTTATATSNVGDYNISYVDGLTHELGYAIAADADAPGTYSVTPRVLDLHGTRVYDGTTGLASTLFEIGNLANGDTLNLSGSGSMADRHAGDGKAVTLGTLELADGASSLASNYTLAGGMHTVDIEKAAITISTSDVVKTYDGTTAATGTAIVTAGALFGSDALTGGDFTFDSADAGEGKTVTVDDVTVNDGNGGGNYEVTYAANTSSTIDKKTLTIGGSFTAGDKVYDGTTDATILDAAALQLAGLVGTETLTLTGLGAAFVDKDAATGKTVNLKAASLADGSGKASNYTLSLADAPTATASITPKALTLGGSFTAADKVYNGTTSATIDAGNLTLDGLVAGEDLDLSGLAGSFADRNAGQDILVNIDAASLADGANGRAANYTLDLDGAPVTTADIERRPVRVQAENQTKPLGLPDPALTYTAEGQSAGRGLLDGETLTGALARAPGGVIGKYAIGPGTLVDVNNPNYAITFVEGMLDVTPSPEVTTAQHVSQIADLVRVVDSTATSGSRPNLSDRPAAGMDDLQYVDASSAEGGAAQDPAPGPATAQQEGATVAGPLTVFVIDGGIRLPELGNL